MRRGTAGSGRLRSSGKQTFRGKTGLELLELALERAFAGFFEVLDHQLVFAARLVEPDARPHQHRHAVLGAKPDRGVPLPPHGAAHLGAAVLQRKIPMPRGRCGEIRKLSFEPQQRQAGFEQQAHFFIEARDAVDIALGAGWGARGDSRAEV